MERSESAATGVSRGRYRRARLLRFSTDPFCQGADGSQNQAPVPMPLSSSRQETNSKPRSKVIERRTVTGRGERRLINRLISILELRSLLRNSTA
jgi:hypothetical protein